MGQITAVVTGSTSGIGKAVADMLESRGMTVIRADRSVADLRDIDSITKAYGQIAKTHKPAIQCRRMRLLRTPREHNAKADKGDV